MSALIMRTIGFVACLVLCLVHGYIPADCDYVPSHDEPLYSSLMQKTFTRSRTLPSANPPSLLSPGSSTAETPQAAEAAQWEELATGTEESPSSNNVAEAELVSAENSAGGVIHVPLSSELQESASQRPRDPPSLLQEGSLDAGSSGDATADNPTGVASSAPNSELQGSSTGWRDAISSILRTLSPGTQGAEVPEAPTAQSYEDLVAWAPGSPASLAAAATQSPVENPEGTVMNVHLNSELQTASSMREGWGWLEALHMSREARRHRVPTGTLSEAMLLGTGFVMVGLIGAAVLGYIIRVLMRGCDKERAAALSQPIRA